MGSAASGFWNGVGLGESQRGRRDERERDEREAKLQTLVNSGLPPAQVQQGIRDIYGQDAPALQRHVENLFRRVAGKQPQEAQAPKRAADLAQLESQAPVPLTKAQQQTASDQAELQFREGMTPKQRDLMGYGAPAPRQQTPANLLAAAIADAQARGVDPNTDPKVQQLKQVEAKPAKPILPQLKQIQGQDVLWDPTTQKVVKVFGPHGTARVTNHQAIQTDADGTPHIVNLTSVSTPGGGSVQVDASEAEDNGEAQSPAKQPAPHKTATGGAPSRQNGDRTLPFTKGTPAFNKVQGEYAEAVKLSSIADQVAQNPNDAINQKRLAVALERTAAGRFTTQALDYIIKSGWGNTVEQWANNPSTGALPADVMRQLIDGAHQNLKASKDAVDAIRKPTGSPAPSAGDGPPPGVKIRDYTQLGK